jgi:hypothetical protein
MKLATNQIGIVAQAMQSATQPASSQPVPLLGPETTDGGYNSELFERLNQPNPLKLLETGVGCSMARRAITHQFPMSYPTQE